MVKECTDWKTPFFIYQKQTRGVSYSAYSMNTDVYSVLSYAVLYKYTNYWHSAFKIVRYCSFTL